MERSDAGASGPAGVNKLMRGVARRIAGNMHFHNFKVHVPPGQDDYKHLGEPGDFEATVAEVRAFRSEVFFEGGRRPSFQAADGRPADAEDADYHACHLVCRDEAGALSACLRLGRVDLLPSSAVEEHLGAERAAKLIGELGIDRVQVAEVGRLAVAPGHRRQGGAAMLLMTSHVLARRLNCPVIWATVGEGDGQHRFLIRFGTTLLSESSAFVPRYNDTASVAIHDHRVTLPQIGEAVAIVERAIFGSAARTFPIASPSNV